MSLHSTYDTLRHFADSWGLLAMAVTFIALAAWPFRPGGSEHNRNAVHVIFKDDTDGQA